MSKEYAVLFKKEPVSFDYNVYLFKPVTIIEGVSDVENGVFLDDLNIERGLFDDPDLLLSDMQECAGYVMTEEDILKAYPDARSLDEAKIMFNDDLANYMIFGMYDHNNDKVRIIKFSLEEITKNLFKASDGEVKQDSEVSKKEESPTEEPIISYYEKLKASLNNKELTIIPLNQMEYIANLNTLEEIKKELRKSKKNKDIYESYLRNSSTTVYIVPDESVNELLKVTDIGKLKEMLNYAINSYKEMDAYDEDPVTSSQFIDSYKAIYNQMMSSDNIKVLHKYAKEVIGYFTFALQELVDKDYSSEITESIQFIKDEIDTLKSMLKIDNLEQAKKLYVVNYMRNLKIINTVADQLTNSNIQVKEDEEGTEEVTSEAVDIDKIISKSKEAMKDLNELIGLENIKKVFEELIKSLIFREKIKGKVEVPTLNLNMVFKGNPGTGKTTVARIISKLLYELGYIKSKKVKECTAKDFIGEYVGQTAPKASHLIAENRGGVIFIDEAYVFAGQAQQFAQEALAEIMKELETNRTVFIFAGYSKEMGDFIGLNSGIESRIGYNMEFIDYSEEQLYQMLENKFKKGKYVIDPKIKDKIISLIHEAKQSKNFGNGRFIDNLYMKIYLSHVSNVYMSENLEELITISEKDITNDLLEKPKVKTIGF